MPNMTITMAEKAPGPDSYWQASGMGPLRRIVVEGPTRGKARILWHEEARKQRDEQAINEESDELSRQEGEMDAADAAIAAEEDAADFRASDAAERAAEARADLARLKEEL